MNKIDPLFYAHSTRIDLKDETRIKATSEEAIAWAEEHRAPDGMWYLPLLPSCQTESSSIPLKHPRPISSRTSSISQLR